MQIETSAITAYARSDYSARTEESLILNETSRRPVAAQRHAHAVPRAAERSCSEEETPLLEGKYRAMILALEALTGEKIRLTRFRPKAHDGPDPSRNQTARESDSPTLVYERMQAESSRLDVRFAGSYTTESGRSFDFSLSIEWEQAFAETRRLSIRDGEVFEDPLILSFDGLPPVAAGSFDFDLTADADRLNLLNGSAAYLVMDRNGNGRADDGSELFGPATSDGFGELAALDEDGNGWIDNGDTRFKQLRLWRPQLDGDTLVGLEAAGIGALSLQSVALDYTAKTSINAPVAHYKEASVAVGTEGEAYALFSVDLAG